jgi:hypothetical protein
MVEAYLEILDEGYFEVGEAFRGLENEHVWKRPADGLLSIGEIAGHIAYWEAVKFAGEGGTPYPDLEKCRVSSLLIDHRFRYYQTTLANAPSPEHLAMSAAEVGSELQRVHTMTMAYFKELNPDLESCPPGWSEGHTYHAFLTYAAIHIAYHTGQIYTVRHLFGEETPDN